MTKRFWLSTTSASGVIEVDREGYIVAASPMFRKRLGEQVQEVVRELSRKHSFTSLTEIHDMEFEDG